MAIVEKQMENKSSRLKILIMNNFLIYVYFSCITSAGQHQHHFFVYISKRLRKCHKKQTCPKGFGVKLAKLGLKIPLKNKVKQKQSKAEPS